jgi:26S proteasome regulatory subunit T2
MGNMGNKGLSGANQQKKNEEKKPIKKPDTSNVKLGKKKKKKKGVDIASKLPNVTPLSKCLLRMRKFERIKDYLLMEEEFVKSQSKYKTEDEKAEEEKSLIDLIRGSPISIGTLEEIINEDYAIISVGSSEYYVRILSIVDKEQLELGCSVLLRSEGYHITGVLADEADPLLNVMKVDKAPNETYGDIGGLEAQIREIKVIKLVIIGIC